MLSLRNPRVRAPLIAAALAIVLASSVLFAQPGIGEMPLSIRRIVLPPERLAKELEKIQQGTLISLPLAEFDARLDRARKAAQARELKPRLTRASYRAELVDGVLTNGSGQWTVHHPGKAPAVLPIDPFNLAMHAVKWETGADAMLAELDGKTLGLLVNESGVQTCLFDWSARGTPTNEGLAFNLSMPPCPITSFDFTLPAEYWLTAPKSAALVLGPAPAESSRSRRWTVQVTGQGHMELALRKVVDGTGPAPTVIAQVLSTQSLTPDRVQIDYEFQIEILHGSVRELVLDGDGSLEPYEVALRSGEIKAWQWKEPSAKIDPKAKIPVGRLTIQFHHPMQGKIQGLKVRSLAPRPSARLWTSPALRVRDSLSRGETLKVQLHPNLALGKWDSGTFQVMQVAADSDDTQVITLADAAPDASTARRPAFWPVAAGLDLHTVEKYAWHVERRSAGLHADIEYALARGSLSELRIRLPKSFPVYQLESVEMQPADLLHRWYPSGDFLVVELQQPLSSAKKAHVKIQMRAAFREIVSGVRDLSYPELEPMDSTNREGAVAITVDPMLQGHLLNATLPPSAFDESARGQRQPAPSFAFAFRNQKLSAALRLAPQPAQMRWQGQHQANLGDQRASVQFRWEVEPITGAPEFLDLRFAPGFPAVWKLRAEEGTLRVHHWERLPLSEVLPHLLRLGSKTATQAALLDAMLPEGSYWRFHLSEPLRTKASFVIETSVPAGMSGAAAKIWPLSLMIPAQSGDVHQTLSVESPNEPIEKVRTEGPIAVQASAGTSAQPPVYLQAVQTSDNFPNRVPSLTLWTKPSERAASKLELCDEARCATDVHRDGRLTHRIQFRLWHWRDRTCELLLPAGVQVLAVKLRDHWLDRLDVKEDGTLTRVLLPFDQSAEFVRYEILARAQAPMNWFDTVSNIDIPIIGWPLPPDDMRLGWRLEKGLMPLHSGTITRVGVPDRIARQTPSVRWLTRLANGADTWWPSGAQTEAAERLESQKQAMLSAESQFRAEAAKVINLSEALERFTVHYLKEHAALVIDDTGFQELGIGPETVLPAGALHARATRPFWESLGLVYLPCPGGALLTSPARMKELGIDPSQAADLHDAIVEAVLHGRDASGGFFFVLTWLQMPRAEPLVPFGARTSLSADHPCNVYEMTQWQLLPGPTPSAGFWVVDVFVARAVGLMLALLMALILWRVQRALAPGTAFRVVLLILTASAVAAIWIPLGWREFVAVPVLMVQGVGLLGCLLRMLRHAGRAQSTGKSTIVKPAAAAMILGLLVCLPWMADAQPPVVRSYPVLILEGAKPAALVTPDLLSKLDELENPSASGAPDAVLVKAKYVGRIKDATATVEAQYELHSFKDQVALVIPLAGVQLLEGAFLDGAPVFPTVHKNGYVVPIRGKGVHHLRLPFTARIAATNDHVDLRFTIPKLAQNEITLQTPASMPPLQCLHCGGEENRRPGAGPASREWHAQLGYENVVHLRWANTVARPALKTVDVHEAHCWDLRPSSFALASSFHFALGNGSMSELSVTVPDGLHVRKVEAMTLPPGAAPPASLVIKHWQMLGKGAQRRVRVEFGQPVTGQIVLGFEFLAPALANVRALVLPLPAALQGKSVSGILGYRLQAAEVRSTAQNLAVKNMDTDSFEQQWKKQWSHPIPTELRAYSFQRKAQQAGLELVIQPTARQAQMQIRWSVDLSFADVHARVTLSSVSEDLSFLEFFVDPSMTLASVVGPDVRRWHRQDSLLQVWLRQPRKQTTLELTGWRAFDKNAILDPKKRFAVPSIYPLQTQITAAVLQVEPKRGIQIDAEILRRLRASPGAKLQWVIEDAPYEGVFWLRLESPLPEATLLTRVHKTEDGIEVTYSLCPITERGKLPAFKLRLKDWHGEPMRFAASGAVVQPIRDGAARDPAWSVKYPAGLPQEVHLTLRGRLPTSKDTHIALPSVELEGAAIRAAWCAWSGVELADARTGKQLVNDPRAREEVINLPDERWPSDMAAWRCAEVISPLKVRMPKSPQSTNLHVLGFAEEVRLTDARKWLHKATFWVQAPASTELRVKFPARVDPFSVFLDQRLHSAGNLSGDEIILPLGATGLPRRIELNWEYAQEVLDSPNLMPLQIVSARMPTTERVLWVPSWSITSVAKPARSPTLLTHLLRAAETHMQVSAALSADSADAIRAARKLLVVHQRAFHDCLRQAEYLTAVLGSISSAFDPATLQANIEALRDRNAVLAKERGYADESQAAASLVEGASILLPAAERLPPGSPLELPADRSALPLDLEGAQDSAERRARSELVLLVAVFLLVFSYFRQGLSLVRLVAPEFTAGLLLLAWWFGAVGLVGAVALIAVICLRLTWMMHTLHRRRRLLTTDFEVSQHASTENRSAP